MLHNPKAIAEAYDALPILSVAAIEPYREFCRQVAEQFDALPVRPIATDDDPYHTSGELFAGIDAGKYLVYRPANHPLMTEEENWRFRAVHDYYGHFIGRNPFGFAGECRAWLQHLAMFSGIAADVVTTESFGQNCWFNFGPASYLPRPLRPFPKQKAALLPRRLWE